jgi:RNA polymerase sigma-70 factor (ECF subfamily)
VEATAVIARDAEDTRLLEQGDLAGLLAKYEPTILGRCVAKLRGHRDAEDVAQNVLLRLVAEFSRGKRYGETPYRVVVHKVVDWTVADYFEGRSTAAELPADWDPGAADFSEELVSRYYVADLLGPLPEREQQVMERFYLLGWNIQQIADDLAIDRNAVDQALFRGRARLREVLTDG